MATNTSSLGVAACPAIRREDVGGPDAGTSPAVEFAGVTKRYGHATVVKDCTFAIQPHEFVSILGPSGCGKTTILQLIGGFCTPEEGAIRIHGQDMTRRPPNKRPVTTVFQDYALFPHMTVLENVMFPLEVARTPKADRRQRALAALELVRLTGHTDHGVARLSGGQAQRVALARALVGEPEVLLLDECLSALDLKLRKQMQSELRRIHDETGTTFVFVTHDQTEAMAMSDRIILMSDGSIEQIGAPREIYEHPASAYASDFLGSANLLSGAVVAIDGAVGKVQCGQFTLEATMSRPYEVGEAVLVSIRPENIRLVEPIEPAHAWGEVVAVAFLGNAIRVTVLLADGPSVEVEYFAASSPNPGERVGLHWNADRAIAFPKDGRAS
jgi:spermidine/putrescine transport system ATP-binding protein